MQGTVCEGSFPALELVVIPGQADNLICRRRVTTPALAVTNTVTALFQPGHKWSHLYFSTPHSVNLWVDTTNKGLMCIHLGLLCNKLYNVLAPKFYFFFYGPQLYHFLFSAICFTTLFHTKKTCPWCTALQKNRERRIHFVLSCKIDIRNKLQTPDAEDGRGAGHHL